jgi:hypothetical protein
MPNNSGFGGNYRRNFGGCCNSLILAPDNIPVARPVVVPADIQLAVVLDNIQVARPVVVPADIQLAVVLDNIQVARTKVVPADIQLAVVLDNIQFARTKVVPADIQVVPMVMVAPVLAELRKLMSLQAQVL